MNFLRYISLHAFLDEASASDGLIIKLRGSKG